MSRTSAQRQVLLAPGIRPILSDEFTRADTSAGTLGKALTGQAWELTGTGYLTVQVLGNRAVCPNDNVYIYTSIAQVPVGLKAMVSWTGDAGAGGGVTLISSPFSTLLETMIHAVFDYDSWVLQVREAGGSFVSLGSGNYAAPCALDGTSYPIGWSIAGNTATVRLPDGTAHYISDYRLSLCNGRWLTYQLFNGATGPQARFDSVVADAARAA